MMTLDHPPRTKSLGTETGPAGNKALANTDMKKGRFLKLFHGRRLFNRIQAHLAQGGSVVVTTMTKATRYSPKHASMIRVGSTGDLLIQHGSQWSCLPCLVVEGRQPSFGARISFD